MIKVKRIRKTRLSRRSDAMKLLKPAGAKKKAVTKTAVKKTAKKKK